MSKDLTRVSRSKKGKGCFVFTIIFLLLIGIVSGVFFYSKVYIPRKVRAYVEKIEENFVDIDTSIGYAKDNINEIFGLDEKSQDNFDKSLSMAKELSNQLSINIESAQNTLPAKSIPVEYLDSNLRVYYESSEEFIESYQDLSLYFETMRPLMSKVNDSYLTMPEIVIVKPADITDTIMKYESKRQEFQNIKEEIERVKSGTQTRDYHEQMVKYVSEFILYCDKDLESLNSLITLRNQNAEALKRKDVSVLKSYSDEYTKVVASFDIHKEELQNSFPVYSKATDEYATKTKEYYLDEIREINFQGDRVKEILAELKQKHKI